MFRKKRLPLFMALIALFIVFWLIYMAVILSSTSRVFQSQIETRVDETVEQLSLRHKLDLAELAHRVYMSLDGAPADVQSVAGIASGIEAEGSEGMMFAADESGMLYAGEGATGQRLNNTSLAAASSYGSFVQSITMISTKMEGIATIIPLTSDGVYLVKVLSMDGYALDIADHLAFEPE